MGRGVKRKGRKQRPPARATKRREETGTGLPTGSGREERAKPNHSHSLFARPMLQALLHFLLFIYFLFVFFCERGKEGDERQPSTSEVRGIVRLYALCIGGPLEAAH